jgi:hypothetical protein
VADFISNILFSQNIYTNYSQREKFIPKASLLSGLLPITECMIMNLEHYRVMKGCHRTVLQNVTKSFSQVADSIA